MRRVAANIVYMNREVFYKNHVVEIYGNRVVCHYALKSELAMTEWLGGIIVLANTEHADTECVKSMDDFFDRLEAAEDSSGPLRAYHIRNADVNTKILTENSRIYLIEESEDEADISDEWGV